MPLCNLKGDTHLCIAARHSMQHFSAIKALRASSTLFTISDKVERLEKNQVAVEEQ